MKKINKSLSLFLLIAFQMALINPVFSIDGGQTINFSHVGKNTRAYKLLQALSEQYNLKIRFPENLNKGDKEISSYEVAAVLLQVLSQGANKEIEAKDKSSIVNLIKEYTQELDLINSQIETLQDQNDIKDTKIDQINDNMDQFNKVITFRPFGSIAFRHCIMSTNIITDSQNIIKNLNGNSFQTRISGGVTGNFVSDFNYQLRILTIDPNSFNLPWLPLGSNLIRLPFYFDRFFINYKPAIFNNSTQSLKFSIGKSLNFLPETELLFDEDVSFNGLSQEYSFKLPENNIKEIFFGLTENVISSEGTFMKSFILGAKVAAELNLLENLNVRTGVSYSDFFGVEGLANFQFSQGFPGPTSLNNRIKSDSSISIFTSDFNLLDTFLKITYSFNERLPLEIYGDLVNNFGSPDKNQGFMVGAKFGKLIVPGDLFFNYNYKSLAQDYNLSFLVQDQMGGTDVKGHQFDFGVKIAAKTSLLFTLQNRTSISRPQNPDFYILYSTIRQDF